MGDATVRTPEEEARRKSWKHVMEWLDVIAKLSGGIAIVFVAYAANSFQSKMTRLTQENQNRTTMITLQSQREQAESSLRATMFSNLLGPIAGPSTGSGLSADREKLLVELLALNFHENFELKPLMEDVDKKLSKEPAKPTGNPTDDPRESLRSVARRVADRQIASIRWGWGASSAPSTSCQINSIYLRSEGEGLTVNPQCNRNLKFEDVTSVNSPDGKYSLQIIASGPNWKDQTVQISVAVRPTDLNPQDHGSLLPSYRFELTWFDLPLTDNTLLSDGNRFAIDLEAFESDAQRLTLRVIWFPKDYFTPRERPLDYRELQKLLGQKPGGT
jgi:hypothetical protein